jgi:two-component system, OmpR family, KDP operon response regulator KdpE
VDQHDAITEDGDQRQRGAGYTYRFWEGGADTTMAAPLVLLVEGDPDLRRVLTDVLNLGAYRVVAAGSSSEGLSACVAEVPDLLVLDMRLPDMSGVEFASHLRLHGWALPILVITGLFRARWCAQEIEAEAWLAKPFDLDRFLAAVQQLCPSGR